MPKQTFHNLPDAKRQRILDAAIAEFSTVAFEAASLNRIVKGAGIAKGSFYQYFDDLFDLFRWLVIEFLAREKMAFIQSLGPPQGGDLFDQIAWAIVGGMRWALAQPTHAACGRQLWSHTNFGPLAKLQAELHGIGHSQMRHILADGQKQGLVRMDVDLDVAAAMMAGLRDTVDLAMRLRLGFGPMDLATTPELEVDLDAVHDVVREVIHLMRLALGTGASGGELHLEATPFARHLRGEE